MDDLKCFFNYYNYQRYPTDSFGYTPMKILEGKIPDKHLLKIILLLLKLIESISIRNLTNVNQLLKLC